MGAAAKGALPQQDVARGLVGDGAAAPLAADPVAAGHSRLQC